MNSVSIESEANVASTAAPLLSPLTIRGVALRNRIVLSPMCQFCAVDGFADDWHLVHLTARAIGGAGLVFTEATAVTPEGRITPGDLGLWDEAHVEPLRRIVRNIIRHGAVPGIQLAHAGRKGSRHTPWDGSHPLGQDEGAWQIVGPSAVPFDEENARTPVEMSLEEIDALVDAFESAALRAVEAGFQVIEVHAAHGYLLHEFLSPVSNHRLDEYGGNLENRMRLVLRVAERLREVMPESMPLFIRISATDWISDGPSWDLDQAVELSRRLKAIGVDLIDASSGAVSLRQKITVGPGYQVPFARRIRKVANVRTGAVGLITQSQQANEVIVNGDADLVFIGRAFLRNPYWGLIAQEDLIGSAPWPNQYGSQAARRR